MNLTDLDRRVAALAGSVATLAEAAAQHAEMAELAALPDDQVRRLYRELAADPAPLPAGMAGLSTARLAARYRELP